MSQMGFLMSTQSKPWFAKKYQQVPVAGGLSQKRVISYTIFFKGKGSKNKSDQGSKQQGQGSNEYLGGGFKFKYMFYVHLYLGKISIMFNHQPDRFPPFSSISFAVPRVDINQSSGWVAEIWLFW